MSASFGWGDDVPESRLLSLRGPFVVEITIACRVVSSTTPVDDDPSMV
jgi:hypothetical protein